MPSRRRPPARSPAPTGRQRSTVGAATPTRCADRSTRCCSSAPDQDALDRGAEIGAGIAFGRDLANRSANDLFPERMAEVARELEADGCEVEVLEPDDMERLGMGLLLGVGQGAAHPPRMIAIKLPGWKAAAGATAGHRRQGRVLRLRRYQHQAGRRHGRHEARQVGRRGGDRGRPDGGAARAGDAAHGGRADGREHARRQRAAAR